jgi:uncharacterized protein YndB with AHSA1/START domain
MVDPTVTTKFWFTRSSGPLEPGATVEWVWEMFDASTKVRVKELEEDRRVVFDWGDDDPTTVEMRFVPTDDGATWMQVIESGFSGDGDAVLARVAGSTGGFTNVLCALKALLEHDVRLTTVADHAPPGDREH